eukprot:PhF_6_TR41567/c0_g1_i1/m.62977
MSRPSLSWSREFQRIQQDLSTVAHTLLVREDRRPTGQQGLESPLRSIVKSSARPALSPTTPPQTSSPGMDQPTSSYLSLASQHHQQQQQGSATVRIASRRLSPPKTPPPSTPPPHSVRSSIDPRHDLMERELTELKRQLRVAHDELHHMKDSTAELRSTIEVQRRESDADKNRYEFAITNLNELIARVTLERDAIKGEADKMVDEIRSLERAAAVNRDEHNDMLSEWKRDVETFTKELYDLCVTLDCPERSNRSTPSDLHNNMRVLRNAISTLRNTLDETEQDNVELRRQCDDQSGQIDELKIALHNSVQHTPHRDKYYSHNAPQSPHLTPSRNHNHSTPTNNNHTNNNRLELEVHELKKELALVRSENERMKNFMKGLSLAQVMK